jgi:hypothetical protein
MRGKPRTGFGAPCSTTAERYASPWQFGHREARRPDALDEDPSMSILGVHARAILKVPAVCWGVVKRRPLPVLLLLILTAYIAYAAGTIELRLYQNRQAQREITEALAANYPGLQFRASASYESPRVYLYVYDVVEPAKQAEIKRWLARLKADRALKVVIWLCWERMGDWDGEAITD